jgi:mannose-6-phosphate isomerase-like protein (cupin superfamily)
VKSDGFCKPFVGFLLMVVAFASGWQRPYEAARFRLARSCGTGFINRRRLAMKNKVVVKKSDFIRGAPMEARPGVRDIKLIYPETGVPSKSLVMGIVEVEPGAHSPLHKHNCEEVYYVMQGKGEIESEGVRHAFEAGDAVLNRETVPHRVFNSGDETVRLIVVGGIMFVGLLPKWPTESPYEIYREDL